MTPVWFKLILVYSDQLLAIRPRNRPKSDWSYGKSFIINWINFCGLCLVQLSRSKPFQIWSISRIYLNPSQQITGPYSRHLQYLIKWFRTEVLCYLKDILIWPTCCCIRICCTSNLGSISVPYHFVTQTKQ